MTKQKSFPLKNVVILLFVIVLLFQFFYSSKPSGPGSQPAASNQNEAKSPTLRQESSVVENTLDESPEPEPEQEITPEAKAAYEEAARIATGGDLTATAEALHDAVQEAGLPNIEQIYRDSRFKDFLGSRQHADLLLVLGEEPTPEKGFPPIYFNQ